MAAYKENYNLIQYDFIVTLNQSLRAFLRKAHISAVNLSLIKNPNARPRTRSNLRLGSISPIYEDPFPILRAD